MLLAAILDAGCPLEPVEAAVRACGVDVRLGVAEVRRAGLRGALLRIVPGSAEPPERTLATCIAAVEDAGLPGPVRDAALATLRALGAAEAALHGVPEADVHLHELAATDTLVDIVGVCAALHVLGVTALRCSPLPAGAGHVDTAHGELPLPAPATLRLLAAAGAPLVPGVDGVEQVTPTAAALLATLATFAPPRLRLRGVGHGAGSRDDPLRPNLVRCWLGDPLTEAGTRGPEAGFDDPCVELRTNLDDASPAVVAALAARCLEVGALDAWVVAATMKKGRPGHVLHVLVPAGGEAAVAALLLAESPTLGVRRTEAARMVAGRDGADLDTALGRVRIKRKLLGGRVVDARPELDDCVRIARERGLPLDAVIAELTAAARASCTTATGAQETDV